MENQNQLSRRSFWKLGGAFLAALFAKPVLALTSKHQAGLPVEPLFDIELELETVPFPDEIKALENRRQFYQGIQKLYAVKNGKVSGSKLQGHILSGSGDWTVVQEDGAGKLRLHVPLQTHDGERVQIRLDSILHAPKAVLQQIRAGRSVKSTAYYFRVTPGFETLSPRYRWLNQITAVGKGEFTGNGVRFSVYALS